MEVEFGPQPPQPVAREEIQPWIDAAMGARLNAEVIVRLMPPKEGSFFLPSAGEDAFGNMAWLGLDP